MKYTNRPINSGKPYTVQELFGIYQNYKRGSKKRKWTLYAKDLQRTTAAILGAKSLLVSIVDAKSDSIARSIGIKSAFGETTIQSIFEVRKMVDAQRGSLEPKIVTPPHENLRVESTPNSVDRFTKLETAFTNFQSALIEFVEAEVELRTKEKLESQRSQYEQKIRDLEEVAKKAKDSNWLNGLRQKFQTT